VASGLNAGDINAFASSQGVVGSRGTTSTKVSIEGTGIASTVDGNGEFTLTDVPSGTVVLKFSGPGTEASLTISGVREGDQIRIKVRLESSNARVESEYRRRSDEEDDDRDGEDDDEAEDKDDRDGDRPLEVRGAVSGLSGTCPALTFMVGERKVTTSAATTFGELSCSRIQNMVRVEAQGELRSDGSFAATRVWIAG
jgi:hypothetical protein